VKRGEFDKTPLLKGVAIHSILENLPNKSTHKLAHKYQYIVDSFMESPLGTKYLSIDNSREFRFGLTKDLKPTEYKDKNAMFRGAIDLIGMDNDILYLCDWKSGKYKDQKYQNYDQLMFYAIYFFVKYPKVSNISISYVYVEHNIENSLLLSRDNLDVYVSQLSNQIISSETDVLFAKSYSKLCDWCPYKEHCDNDK